MIFNGAALLCLIGIVACVVWAFWPEVRALLGRITTDLFQDAPQPDAHSVIACSIQRAGGSEDTIAFAARHHGGAA